MELKDLNPSDNQAVFDFVVGKLREQRAKFGDSNCKSTGDVPTQLDDPVSTVMVPGCAYRGADGKKCAVGHLIPDEDYRPEWENKKPDYWTDLGKYFRGKGYDLLLLNKLQSIHDWGAASNWEQGWERLARYYKLIYTPPSSNS